MLSKHKKAVENLTLVVSDFFKMRQYHISKLHTLQLQSSSPQKSSVKLDCFMTIQSGGEIHILYTLEYTDNNISEIYNICDVQV